MNIYSEAIEQLGIFTIVGGILAVVATVLAYVFIVPEKRREKLNAFGKFLHDTCNFKYLIVEKILQTLYIFFTADMIILGFFMLFAAPKDYFGNRHWLGVYGILTMILGPIMIRLVYELLMMAVLLLKNVISINNKLRSQNGNEEKNGIFMAPDMSDLRQQLRSKAAQPQNPQPQVPQSAPAARSPKGPRPIPQVELRTLRIEGRVFVQYACAGEERFAISPRSIRRNSRSAAESANCRGCLSTQVSSGVVSEAHSGSFRLTTERSPGTAMLWPIPYRMAGIRGSESAITTAVGAGSAATICAIASAANASVFKPARTSTFSNAMPESSRAFL